MQKINFVSSHQLPADQQLSLSLEDTNSCYQASWCFAVADSIGAPLLGFGMQKTPQICSKFGKKTHCLPCELEWIHPMRLITKRAADYLVVPN